MVEERGGDALARESFCPAFGEYRIDFISALTQRDWTHVNYSACILPTTKFHNAQHRDIPPTLHGHRAPWSPLPRGKYGLGFEYALGAGGGKRRASFAGGGMLYGNPFPFVARYAPLLYE